MRAVRYYGPGDVRVDEVPEPSASEGHVKVKVAWTGICGSDLHSWHEVIPGLSPTSTTPQPVTQEVLPVTMGHEFSGTIVEVGPGVDTSRLAVGTKVAIEPLLSCMKCVFCQAGTRNLCRNATFIGIGGRGGGLAEYVAVEQKLVHPLPSNIPLDVGALIEPLAVAWHAAKASKMKAGDKVFVLGAGPIGLLTVKVARAFGASWIGVSEPAARRRELVQRHGATIAYDPIAPGADVVAGVTKATGGWGADVVFDCAGSQRTLDTAFQAVKPRGCIVNVAVWDARPTLDIGSLTYKEINLTSVLAYDREHPELIQAVAEGKFEGLDTLITRRIGLEDVVDKGIKALINEKDEHVKILVSPDVKPGSFASK
ncbi:alcohol dehydrogenase GroES domain protein [Trametes elegans]|nr:alcohol dehydrogenase GroES domain protein [Trametes elegans]